MASFTSFLALILLGLCFPFFFSYKAEAISIESVCNATTYADLCMVTLYSDPSSATADIRGMARIVAQAAINGTLTTLHYLSRNETSQDRKYYVVVEKCDAEYVSAYESLQDGLRTLKAEPFLESRALEDMAEAEESFGTCREVFTELSAGPRLLPVMQERIEHLCVLVADIVDQLISVYIIASSQ